VPFALTYLVSLVLLAAMVLARKKTAPSSEIQSDQFVSPVAAGFAPNSNAASAVRGSDKVIETVNRYMADPEQFGSVRVKNWDWYRDGFGRFMVSDFVLENMNGFAVAEIEMTCALFDDRGAIIDTKVFRLHQIMMERSSRAIHAVSLGYADPQCASSIGFVSNFSALEAMTDRASTKSSAARPRLRERKSGSANMKTSSKAR